MLKDTCRAEVGLPESPPFSGIFSWDQNVFIHILIDRPQVRTEHPVMQLHLPLLCGLS